MNRKEKRAIFITLVLFAVCSILLSAGLSQLTLKAGRPFPVNWSGPPAKEDEDDQLFRWNVPPAAILIIIFFPVAVLITVFIIRSAKKSNEKSIALKAIVISLVVLAGFIIAGLLLIQLNFAMADTPKQEEEIISDSAYSSSLHVSPVPEFVLWIAASVLTGLAGLLVFRLVFQNRKRTQLSDIIEMETADAREAVRSGRNLKEIILGYYYRMCEILNKEQNIRRQSGMTVTEFEYQLEVAGAPAAPVKALTVLFEAARYGNWNPGKVEEETAFRCFDEIVDYFRSADRECGR